jgi:HPt (histidine-containing phosphotransfer) domain-containing protein
MMAELWFDQDFWDDNFGDFDKEDLDEILMEAVADIEELLTGLLSNDLDVIAKNAHKIVSACGNFGYLQCAELAAYVEQKAKLRELSEEDNSRLIDMVERVVTDLRK